MAESPSLEALMREMSARFEGLELRVTETREDAREARDAATRLTERLGAQDMPAKVAELKGEMNAGFQGARADLVNGLDKITRESRDRFSDVDQRLGKHEHRIALLESFRDKAVGAGGLFTWLSKNAPWLVAVLLAVAAALGWKDKI
jgi:outer membrane murein-binding lipoprotein Lpp